MEAEEPGGRSQRVIHARWVDAREESLVGVVSAWAAVIALGILAADDLFWPRLLPLPHGPDAVAYVLPVFALVALAPWLRRAMRPKRARVRVEAGAVRVDDGVVRAGEVQRVSVATGARGASVGWVDARGRATFLEVERRADALAIARALGGGGGQVDLGVRALPRWLPVLQVVVALACGIPGVVNLLANLRWLAPDLKAAGFATVALAPVVALLATLRWSWRRRTAPGGGARFDEHAALHAGAPAGTERPEHAEEGSERRSAAATVLGRNGEPAAAWLARLDSLPKEGSAYRGASLDRDALHAVLTDEDAPADARAGAARLLALRFEETKASLVRVVADPEVRLRVEVAAYEEDPELAGGRLERLGPLFRAR